VGAELVREIEDVKGHLQFLCNRPSLFDITILRQFHRRRMASKAILLQFPSRDGAIHPAAHGDEYGCHSPVCCVLGTSNTPILLAFGTGINHFFPIVQTANKFATLPFLC